MRRAWLGLRNRRRQAQCSASSIECTGVSGPNTVRSVLKGLVAGSVTAALYLDRFVPPTQPWAHLDVYAWNDSDRAGRPAGGEALALRSAYAMLKARYGG